MLDQKDETLTLTVPEAAKLLRISRGAAYESVRTGSIPAIRFGRTIRIPRYALERLLAGCGRDSKEKNTGI
jgi:excisionase family DNA binding protein